MDFPEFKYQPPSKIKFEHQPRCQQFLPPYNCPQCSFSSDLRLELRSHLYCAHFQRPLYLTKILKEYCCTYCSFRSHSLLHVFHHYSFCAQNTRDSDGLLQCPHCPFKAKCRAYLHDHAQGRHADLVEFERFECEQCSFSTNDVNYLKQHVGRRHLNEVKGHRCPHCHFRTSRICSLKIHIMSKHVELVFKCSWCALTVDSKGKLDEHMSEQHLKQYCKQRHKSKEWFKCVHCNFTSRKKKNMKRHVLCKHTEPNEVKWYQCDHCVYTSKNAFNLKRHVIMKHADEADIAWFECEQCQFKAKTKMNLQKHVRSKHLDGGDVEWFHCEQCSFKSRCKSYFKEHVIQKHKDASEVQLFQCELCEYKSKLRKLL